MYIHYLCQIDDKKIVYLSLHNLLANEYLNS